MINSAKSDHLERAVVWRNLEADGMDYCALMRAANGWQLQGTVITGEAGNPMLVRYEVRCDEHWLTREVEVKCRIGPETKTLHFTVDKDGVWRSAGRELASVSHCVDVDLAITPATNTLPIRRLDLAIGETKSVTAAWVKFPDLAIDLLPQRYMRISELRYRYETEAGFSAELQVDEFGLIEVYPGGWERIAGR